MTQINRWLLIFLSLTHTLVEKTMTWTLFESVLLWACILFMSQSDCPAPRCAWNIYPGSVTWQGQTTKCFGIQILFFNFLEFMLRMNWFKRFKAEHICKRRFHSEEFKFNFWSLCQCFWANLHWDFKHGAGFTDSSGMVKENMFVEECKEVCEADLSCVGFSFRKMAGIAHIIDPYDKGSCTFGTTHNYQVSDDDSIYIQPSNLNLHPAFKISFL